MIVNMNVATKMAAEKQLACQLSCPCRPGWVYKNANYMEMHKTSKRHQRYEEEIQLKHIQVLSKKYENEIANLKRQLEEEKLNSFRLQKRVEELERQKVQPQKIVARKRQFRQ